VGWADVATKHDLLSLEPRLEARFEKRFRQVVVTMMSLFATGFTATALAGAVAVAVR